MLCNAHLPGAVCDTDHRGAKLLIISPTAEARGIGGGLPVFFIQLPFSVAKLRQFFVSGGAIKKECGRYNK